MKTLTYVAMIIASIPSVMAETVEDVLVNQAMSAKPQKDLSALIQNDPLLTVSPRSSIFAGIYPWKIQITTTCFWVGEPATETSPSNCQSAFDSQWFSHAPFQNPFYVALPYSDVQDGHTRPEASQVIPWFRQAFVRDGQSVLKDRWIAIRHGNKVCYAQWEDVGPFQVDHWQYVFGSERPRPNRNQNAGLDVSPAVREYLGLNGIDQCDWRFVNSRRIPFGPWTSTLNSNLTLLKR